MLANIFKILKYKIQRTSQNYFPDLQTKILILKLKIQKNVFLIF